MFWQHQVTKDGKGEKKKRIDILFFVIIYDRGRLIERTIVSRFVTLLTLFAWLLQQMGITQKTEAVGMFSAEGEFVEFGHSVLLEGPVEVWTELILVATPIISPITGHFALFTRVSLFRETLLKMALSISGHLHRYIHPVHFFCSLISHPSRKKFFIMVFFINTANESFFKEKLPKGTCWLGLLHGRTRCCLVLKDPYFLYTHATSMVLKLRGVSVQLLPARLKTGSQFLLTRIK